MSDDKFRHHLEQMRASSLHALSFIEGLSLDSYLKDERTKYAVAMCLVVIGENAKQVMDAFPDRVEEISDIEWHKIRGMYGEEQVAIAGEAD